LASLVVANTDPFGSRAQAQSFVEQLPQRTDESLFGYRAGPEGGSAGARRGADTIPPPRNLGGPALSLSNRAFDASVLLAVPSCYPLPLTREFPIPPLLVHVSFKRPAAPEWTGTPCRPTPDDTPFAPT
jgi:hypothetical protein